MGGQYFKDMVGLQHLLSSGRILRSVHFKAFPSEENHGVLELQLVQTLVVILHCKQLEQNEIIAASLSSWNYSVNERCGLAVVSKMTNNC